MSGSFKSASSVFLAVGLSLAAILPAAAQSIEHQPAHNDSTLALVHRDSPNAAASLRNPMPARLQNLIEPQNSSYDPPVQGGPQSSQGSGTR
jgi:hypothetical protein